MKQLEPGTPFEVTYGDGHKIEVAALSARNKRRLFQMLEETKTIEKGPAGSIRVLDLAEEMVRICVPGISEEQLDSMNESQQIEIAGLTIQGGMLSDDDAKKSE